MSASSSCVHLVRRTRVSFLSRFLHLTPRSRPTAPPSLSVPLRAMSGRSGAHDAPGARTRSRAAAEGSEASDDAGSPDLPAADSGASSAHPPAPASLTGSPALPLDPSLASAEAGLFDPQPVPDPLSASRLTASQLQGGHAGASFSLTNPHMQGTPPSTPLREHWQMLLRSKQVKPTAASRSGGINAAVAAPTFSGVPCPNHGDRPVAHTAAECQQRHAVHHCVPQEGQPTWQRQRRQWRTWQGQGPKYQTEAQGPAQWQRSCRTRRQL